MLIKIKVISNTGYTTLLLIHGRNFVFLNILVA